MASLSKVLYVGVTNDLQRRVWQHKAKVNEGFTARYHVTKLVHFESFDNIDEAIQREKQIKKWRRGKKVALIVITNPKWKDLSLDWYECGHDMG